MFFFSFQSFRWKKMYNANESNGYMTQKVWFNFRWILFRIHKKLCFFVYCRWFVPTSELQKTRIMFAWRCIHCTLRFENNASQKSVRIYKHIPMKKSRFFNYAFVICSDEIISVSTQKVTKLGDGSGNIGSPKFSDEIYLTDDFYGSSNTK